MREVFVLSAGAAKAVVLALKADFERKEGIALRTTFGAVGAMRDQWSAGAPCDILILSAKLLDDLARDRAIDARVALGRVRTGIAVRAGSALPPIADGDELRRAFLAATSLYLPDPQRATAGIHCVEVLRRLGILDAMQPRLRAFPNGAAAMAGLATASDERAIGCTQATEILYTPGVTLVGALPAGFELNTEYAAAVAARAREATIARRFVARLGGDETLATRRAEGFEV
ncbi:MAG TPA: substrate-binding domain-containing protein [Burkholderiaceae bacterium]|nr:substrate-binding domain-containing protein [Burkholderiaceae bacterium]